MTLIYNESAPKWTWLHKHQSQPKTTDAPTAATVPTVDNPNETTNHRTRYTPWTLIVSFLTAHPTDQTST